MDALSRRTVVRGAAAVTVAGGTIALMDHLAGGITRAEAAKVTSANDEQYLVPGLSTVLDNGVTVLIPPLYKYIITGNLKRDRTWNAKELNKAQAKLEKALQQAEKDRPRTAAGLTVVVAWGRPYFLRYIKPALKATDWTAIWPTESGQDAVLEARRFPSDPDGTVLEQNEVMIMFRSDSPIILDDVKGKLFKNTADSGYIGDIIDVTSVRTGFVGRGFDTPSIAKQLLTKAGAAVATQIPDHAQLMMGFTSTQREALGAGNIASFETLGLTSVRPGDYFAGGAAMHLSHVYEDLSRWYGSDRGERVDRMFHAGASASVSSTAVTVPNGPGQVTKLEDLKNDIAAGKIPGHNAMLQQATRLPTAVTDVYGNGHAAGSPIPVREDFNTLDAPFTSSGTPQNRPGLHFVVFVPASSKFHRARLAMDGVVDGQPLDGVDPTKAGINAMLETTHRQNFLVPPRTHRSFPMAELLP